MRKDTWATKVLAWVFAVALCLVAVPGCSGPAPAGQDGAQQAETTGEQATPDDAEATEDAETDDEDVPTFEEAEAEAYNQALSGEGLTTTMLEGDDIYDGKVQDETDAEAVLTAVADRIGADDTVEWDYYDVIPTEDDNYYYIFRQMAGDVLVSGASAKVICNKDEKVIAVISSVLPNVQLNRVEEWGLSEKDAEELTLEALEGEGDAAAKIVEGQTHTTIIPTDDVNSAQELAWVVYTNNVYGGEMGYLANYVDEDGNYLYALPVSEPQNSDSLSGQSINFDFDAWEQATYTVDAELHDGSTRHLEVPCLTNDDGDVVLGDAKRKILCADYSAWENDDKIEPEAEDDGFNNYDLLIYDTFIRVWDFYDSIGWTGPDGAGTPTILLTHYVDADGEDADQAYYAGKDSGWQKFAFGRVIPDGENTDVIAHEFTHCVTSTTMTTNFYVNDLGAINEGMSDIMGNLIEIMLDGDSDGDYVIGEGAGEDKILRSMKDPNAYGQPGYYWDVYYLPHVLNPSDDNDQGGVHTNSSLLNICSWKLEQAGMAHEDQFYFWMNVALAMLPTTDYPMMEQLLPWVMNECGYPQYVDTLKQIAKDEGYSRTDTPTTPAAGYALLRFSFPEESDINPADIIATFQVYSDGDDNGKIYSSWPQAETNIVQANVPAGSYLIYMYDADADDYYMYTAEGWKKATAEDLQDFAPEDVVETEADKVKELTVDGLAA